MHRIGRLLTALALLGASAAAPAAGDPAYLVELQLRARELQLAQAPYWHKLLLYKRNQILPGVTSIADTANFFLAPRGKTDPQAELDATLASFFSDALREEEPAQCRAKARYEWLRKQLSFDDARLPPRQCELYEEFWAALKPAAVSLVFAASDLNSPATMYGHTLLRVDAQGQTGEQTLLAHSVNYAASVAEGNAMLYTLQGVSGGFVGEFSINRYYERVRQYVRINNRDLWEYPVRLTPEELQRVMWHLWEMRNVGSDYYFFNQNCSYMLLMLLETARDDLELSAPFDRLLPYVIPVDTIRVLRDAGLLDEPRFRPSMARNMENKFSQLEPLQLDWMLDYAAGDTGLEDPRYAAAPARDRARLLESTNDYLNYRFEAGSLPREKALPASREVLLARSRIDDRAQFQPLQVNLTPPDRGHGSSRASVGVRADEHHAAGLLAFRPAYHDRLDPPAGYLPGGEIEFFSLSLLAHERVQVADLRVVSVQSVTPWDRVFRPWLWQASGGLRRFGADAVTARFANSLGYYVDGGAGYAVGDAQRWMLYGFGFGSLDLNHDIEDGYGFGLGLRTGLALTWSQRLTQELQADWLADAGGAAERQLKLGLGTQWQLAPRHGLRLSLNHLDFGSRETHSTELRWQYYF